jgi:hypothetical protein
MSSASQNNNNSSSSSSSTNNSPVLPTHSVLHFVTPNKPKFVSVFVQIKKEIDDETFEIISKFLDDNFKRAPKSKQILQWTVDVNLANELCHEIDKIIQELNNEESESDDEFIQTALARRYKSQSEGKIIKENIDDSEAEEMIDICRRYRFMHQWIYELQERVSALEKQLAKQ